MRATISRIRCFKNCRMAYRFKYIEGLEPVNVPEPLAVGISYHSKIEQLYTLGYVDISDMTKETAMALAYEKYIYPKFKIKAVEEWFEIPVGDDVLGGRIDGKTEDGCLVEHKSAGVDIGEEYEFNLQWDEQILAYMLATGDRKIYYTVCRKPTIRQKKDETIEDFFWRMVAWYDEDTESKIRVIVIERSDEEIQAFMDSLQDVLEDMKGGRIYRNPSYCSYWGRRCEYSGICLNYDPEQEYVEFVKTERKE